MTSPRKKLILIFDGGSRGNPGPAYGSYLIRDEGKRRPRPARLQFGRATNNEAEYMALLAGLEAVLGRLEAQDQDPGEVLLEVRGDSQLVVQQLNGNWKAKNPRMRALRDQARKLMERFGEVQVVHQDRSKSVEALGH